MKEDALKVEHLKDGMDFAVAMRLQLKPSARQNRRPPIGDEAPALGAGVLDHTPVSGAASSATKPVTRHPPLKKNSAIVVGPCTTRTSSEFLPA